MSGQEFSKVSDHERQVIDRYLRDVPVKLSGLANSLGVQVLASTLPAGISGELRPAPGGFVIKVNRHDSSHRQRFTVAHELSHFVLHRDQIGSGISEDVLYRSQLSDAREAEANRLAAQMLMPAEHVRRMSVEIPEAGEEKVKKLADIFKVSDAAMKIRLEVLGLL